MRANESISYSVMPGLVPGIHVVPRALNDVDGRDRPGHDDVETDGPHGELHARHPCPHNHGAGVSIAISCSTSMRGRITADWSPLTSTSGTSARVL